MPGRPIPDSCRTDEPCHACQPRSAGTGSALPFTKSVQLTFQGVQPLPYTSLSLVPLTVIGSPISVSPNSQRAFDGDRLTQPCDTFRCPWAPTDHGAECTYCPLQVSRCAYSMVI